MVFKNKKITLLLIFTITISGLLFIKPTTAPVTVPTNPKSAPEIISVYIHNTPIWRPPVTTTDSYTGAVTYSNPGYYTCNGSIEITIKNHPFKTYTDKNGKYIGRYYTFFYKDSNTQWHEDFPRSLTPYAEYQSDSANTVITFKYGDSGILYYAKDNTIIDFRVQAVEGHYMSSYDTRDFSDGLGFLYTVPAVYEGIGSKYTEFSITIPPVDKPGTSKLNIQSSSITPSTSNPNSTPTLNNTVSSTDIPSSNSSNPVPLNPLQPQLIIILTTACIITIPIAIVTYLNKQQKTSQKFNDTNDQTL